MLITGANRGLGLEHARQFAARGWQVIACAREPQRCAELQVLAADHAHKLVVEALDVTDFDGVAALGRKLADEPLDLLLNNAGTYGPQGAPQGMAYQSLSNMDYGIWRQMLEVNLLAPLHVSVAMQPALRRSERPLLVMMSSDLGSIANNLQGHSHAYRTTKAGLNMLTKGIAVEWPEVIVVAMAPGWCRTDLGGADAVVDPVDSVREQQQVFTRLTRGDSGRFIDRFGETVAW